MTMELEVTQLPLPGEDSLHRCLDSADQLEQFIELVAPCLQEPTFIGIDTETTGLLPYYGDKLVGVSLYFPQVSQGAYIPIAHQAGSLWGEQVNLRDQAAQRFWSWLADLTTQGHIFVLWNAPFDWSFLLQHDLSVPKRVLDAQVAAYLLNERRSLKLENCVLDDLQEPLLHNLALSLRSAGGYQKLVQLPPQQVCAYAMADAWAPCALWMNYYPRLQQEPKLWDLMRREIRITSWVLDSWRRGLAVNRGLLEEQVIFCEQQAAQLADEFFAGRPGRFNLNNPKLVAQQLKLPNAQKETLARSGDPRASLVIRWKQHHKAKDSFFQSLLKLSTQSADGRVHPCLNQIGTRTGRFSCTRPNLQALPRSEADKNPTMVRVRECIVAEPGESFLFADYSQAELRLISWYAQEQNMVQVFLAGGDIHGQTAEYLYGASYSKAERSKAKTINFAMVYGAGIQEIALQLGVEPAEAQRLLERYHRAYPRIRQFMHQAEAVARQRGNIKLWTGRIIRFDREYDEEYRKASSYLVQGGVAELSKEATLRIDDALHKAGWGRAVFQVHDEIICSVKTEFLQQSASLVRQLGEENFPFDPPALLELTAGQHWADKQPLVAAEAGA